MLTNVSVVQDNESDPTPKLVVPKPMSGFKEFTPAQQIVVNRCIAIIRRHFELAGASPLETPAFERREVLTAKESGDSVDRQIYSVSRLAGPEDNDDTNYALRFDLTVPLARFSAQYASQLTLPYRRYQIQPVWRGERAQAGRFREFIQCDIDVIGDEILDPMTDAEIPAIIYGIFDEMKIGRFQIRVSNRKLLEGILTDVGLGNKDAADAMRTVDKLDKIGLERVEEEFRTRFGLTEAQVRRLLELVSLKGPVAEVIKKLKDYADSNETCGAFCQGLDELDAFGDGVSLLEVPDDNLVLDLSVARGLSYYTGTVYETTLLDHPGIGSICSGGRYDNLASLFTNKKLPGVGISIGLTRLVSRLLDSGILKEGASTTAQVLVTSLDRQFLSNYLGMAGRLRRAGIGAEVYLEKQKLSGQLRYANRKGFRYALIAGDDEFQKDEWTVKDLVTGAQQRVSDANITEFVASTSAV